MTSVNTGPAPGPTTDAPVAHRRTHRELPLYLWSTGLTVLALGWMMKLWRADPSIPFWYSGPALARASLFKSIAQTGWSTFQPRLGVPYGQDYSDAAPLGDLHVVLIRVLSLFTDRWAVTFNLFFLLGFLCCAPAAVWFFRRCGVSAWFSVVLSVLFAVAPYHFLRNENQIFLASYFCVPLGMVLVLRAVRAERLWRRPTTGAARASWVWGRGAGTAVILAVVAFSGVDYALFTALLLAFAGVFGLVRSWSRSRMVGLVAAELALGLGVVLNSLPQLIRRVTAGGLMTPSQLPGAEASAFKLAALLLPAPGYPVPYLARMRGIYDRHYPVPGEAPALGGIAALGLLVLLIAAVTALTGRRRAHTTSPGWSGRRRLLDELTFLTLFAFALGVVGGLGTLVSFFAGDYSGWGRISIVISLFTLAGFGVCAEESVRRLIGSRRLRTSALAALATPVAAVVVLLIGISDQSLTGAVPAYRADAAQYVSDQQFVDRVQATVPTDAMIFQLPYQPFSDTGSARYPPAGAQRALWLHSSTLRWSGGGITGRPQTDWPALLVARSPSRMLQGLAAIGFSGVTIDRSAAVDRGQKWVDSLLPALGRPKLTSQDARYLYYSLAPAIKTLDATTTPAQRAAIAAGITGIAP